VEDRRLAAIGYGDGGGGPQFEMLEVARRVRDLDGCPRASYATVSAFMQALRDEQGAVLPEYAGELYLEGHRGTLTSIAAIKRGNRRAELALRDAEFTAVVAALRGRPYPADDLRAAWKELLLNQFHDILPGSSIPEVNDAAIAGLERCRQQAAAATEQALGGLAGASEAAPAMLVVNSLSWDRGGTLALAGVPAGLVPTDVGSRCQRICDLDDRERVLVGGLVLPALGARRVELQPGEAGGDSPFRVTQRSVETPWARLRFDRSGLITSFVDRNTGRELVRRGGAFNSFCLGEDVPAAWDNWDIDADHRLKLATAGEMISREVVADGPLQLRLRCVWRLGDASQLRQDVVFHAATAQIDFETELEWAEQHRLLKAVFATDLLSPTVRHEIQYGHAERPTHLNRPYDRARFEVCNHKWSDLSENRFGVALLNDCKYGLGAKGGDLALTLVKAGTHPDPRAERGRHRFTYSLLPHSGGFGAESVVRPAYELNVAPITGPVSAGGVAVPSLLTVSAPNVIVEAVKWAEDGAGFVVRLYECERSGTAARIGFGVPVARVCEANMLEEEERELPLRRDGVATRFRPFEIKTLRVYPH
jgi:alpha-mannosidase